MVNTYEIMRGNVLSVHGKDAPQIVDIIGDDTIKFKDESTTVLADDVDEVKITLEVIEKLDSFSVEDDTKYLISGEAYLSKDFKWIEYYNEHIGGWVKVGISGMIHDLQNTHYVLTGSLLEIKL